MFEMTRTGGSEEHSGLQPAAFEVSGGAAAAEDNTAVSVPDSPSKQLPDQISFFSGNPSVEIIHGIMHLYKTK